MKKTVSILVFFVLCFSEIVFAQKSIGISGGNTVSSFVCSNRKVYVWGNNTTLAGTGLLGTGGAASNYALPQVVTFPGGVDIVQVSSGSGSHFIALDCNGNPFAWGNNSSGQVGNGNVDAQYGFVSSPTRVLAAAEIAATHKNGSNQLINVSVVYAGNNSSYAILNNSDLVSWGSNGKGVNVYGYDDNYGQLGNGILPSVGTISNILASVYVRVPGGAKLTGVIQVSATDNVTYALVDPDGDGIGTVYSWGVGRYGMLGRDVTGMSNPISSSEVKDPWARPVRYADGTIMNNITQIAGGDVFGAALDVNGYIWTWGHGGWNNATGNSEIYYTGSDPRRVLKGVTTGASNDGTYLLVKMIQGGQGFGMAVTKDNKPVAWGGGGVSDGGGFSGGSNSGPEYITYTGTTVHSDVIAIYRGDTWGYYQRADGSFWTWGDNKYGQLGVGTVSNEVIQATKINPPSGCGFQDPLPFVNLTSKNITVCASSFTSQVLNSGFIIGTILAPYYTISWYKDGVLVSTGTVLSKGVTYTATQPGVYKVEISYTGSNSGCIGYEKAEDYVTISTWAKTYTVPTDITFCGDSAVVNVNSNVTTNAQYNWYNTISSTTSIGTSTGSNSVKIPVAALTPSTGTDKIAFVEEKGYASGTILKKTQGCDATWFTNNFILSTGAINIDNTYATGFTVYDSITISELSYMFRSSQFSVGDVGSAVITFAIYGSKVGNGALVADGSKLKGTLVTNYTRTRATEGQDLTVQLTAKGNVKLPLGTYFIGPSNYVVTGSLNMGQIGRGNCSLSTGIVDDVNGAIIKQNIGVCGYNNPNQTSSGLVFDIKFATLQHFCDRIPVTIKQSCLCNIPENVTITSTDADLTLCPTGSTTITTNAQANSTMWDFTVYKGSVLPANIVAGPTANISSISQAITFANADTYFIVVRDKANPTNTTCQKQNNITISTAVLPTYTITGGGTSDLGATVNPVVVNFTAGTSPFTITYNPGATNKSAIMASSYTIPAPSLAGTYDYLLTAISDKYCTGTPTASTASTIINPTPAAPTVTTPISYCQNATAIALTATGTSLLWYTAATAGTASATAPTPITTTVGATSYWVTQTIGGIESARAKIDVVVNSIPVSTISNSGPNCAGATIQLFASTVTGATYSWTGPSGFTSTVQNPNRTASTIGMSGMYAAKVSLSGCSATYTTTIIVNAMPSAPTVTSSVTYNLNDVATPLTATGSNLLWYSASTGGTGTATAPTPTTSTVGTVTYYVSQTTNLCESARASISVFVNSSGTTALPTVTTPLSYCQNKYIPQLTATGTSLKWYTVATGGTGSTAAPSPANYTSGTTSYWVTQTIGGIESARAQIDVIVNPQPKANATNTGPFSVGGTIQLNTLSVTGVTYSWTGPNGFTSTLQNPTISSVSLAMAGLYTVKVSSTTCDSISYTTVVVRPAMPTVTATITYCQNSMPTQLTAIGTSLLWYTTATGGSGITIGLTPSTTTVGTKSYWVTQTIGGIESERAKIDVIVNAIPTAPTVTSSVTYNLNDVAAPLTATGTSLLWYSASTGGTGSAIAPTPTTSTVGTTVFYVSQITNSCESAREGISVVVISPKIVQPVISLSATSGNVYSLLQPYDLSAITSLTLSGNIDARDFKTIRDSMPNITILNIANSNIKTYQGPGGTWPSDTTMYPANQLPINTFNYELQGLQTLVLPNSLYSIGNYEFQGFNAQMSIDINNPNFTISDGVLYNKNKTILYYCPRTKTGEFIIPSTVTQIGFAAFYNCVGLTNIVMPEGMESIGNNAFSECKNWVETLKLPSTVIHIGFNAFMNCQGLSGKLVLPASLEFIDFNAFVNCWNLTDEIVVPNKVRYVGNNAFGNCQKITSMTLPASLDSLGEPIIYNASVTKLMVKSSIPLDLSKTPQALSGFSKTTTTLYVPAGSKAAYQNAAVWKDFINIVEDSYFTLSVATPIIGAKQGSYATVAVSSNTSWLAVSTQDWLTITPIGAVVGNGNLTCFATKNIGPARKGVIIISANGMLPQTISVVQEDSIALISKIANVTIDKQQASETYYFTNYFNFGSSTDIEYTVTSSNAAIAKPVISGNKFSIIPYATGKVTFTVTATSKAGVSTLLKSEKQSSFTFDVTVSSSSSTICGTIVMSETITPVVCNGAKTGAITVEVTGGKAPYNYKWSNLSSIKSINNIAAGAYTLIVTDSLGCVASNTYQVTQAQAIQIAETITNPTCGNSNGTISVALSGGTQPYTKTWSNGNSSTQISNLGVGIYSIVVTDSKSCAEEKVFELNNSTAPEIMIDSVTESACNQNLGKISVSITGGTYPYTYNWNDQVQTKNRANIAAGIYSLQVSDANNCTSAIQVEVPQKSLIQPSIALVTVGDETGKNLVIWQKEETNSIDFYTIYRETYVAYQYESIGTVPYSDISIFKDETANPNVQSWRYKISATDVCGNETPLSKEHKTILLQKNLGTQNSVNLDWDSYEGIDFSTYLIYKYSQTGGMVLWKKVPASITRYTNLAPSSGVKGYFVGIDLPYEIDVTDPLLKTESGPFVLAMSNIAEVQTGLKFLDNSKILVYPTETNSIVNICNESKSLQEMDIALFNENGDMVLNIGKTVDSCVQIPVTTLAKGSYIVRIAIGSKVVSKTIIVK